MRKFEVKNENYTVIGVWGLEGRGCLLIDIGQETEKS